MRRIYLTGMLLIVLGCSAQIKDTFNSEELISSKGEKIYINTLNWGVTDDYQISVISGNKGKAQKRSDTIDAIKGLDPFIYKFKNDTLNLYFDREISYICKELFKTIHVKYIPLSAKLYNNCRKKAYLNLEGYCAVPKRINNQYPDDMPKPSSGNR